MTSITEMRSIRTLITFSGIACVFLSAHSLSAAEISQKESTPNAPEASNPPPSSPGQDYSPLTPPKLIHRKSLFGVEALVSPSALGSISASSLQQSAGALGLMLRGDYDPDFIQDFGALTVGGQVGLYPLGSSVAPSILSAYGLGMNIRYQFRFFHSQLLVPTVAYSGELLHLQLNQGQQGTFIAYGPTVGLRILIHYQDPVSPEQAKMREGPVRTYLVTEGRWIQGGTGSIQVYGLAFYAGVRLEL